jgi:sugar phosphate isomerase/epimerase
LTTPAETFSLIASMKTRRHFLSQTAAAAAGVLGSSALAQALRPEGENISFGLCTYMWGADWDIPTLIKNLKQLGMRGVDHAHKVSPELTPEKRQEVRRIFAESEIELIGMGTTCEFDSPDKGKLMTNLDVAKQHVKLSHDIGGSGIKVRPNKLHEKEGIAKEKTLEQIGKALAEVGDFAIGFGQEIRLEVHGEITNLADIRIIMETAKSDNVRVCWNSNPQDATGEGIEKNFALVKEFLGHTTHIHELDGGGKSSSGSAYPYDKLFKLMVEADYEGWMLMEASSKPEDKVKALGDQKAIWTKMMAEARKGA